MTEVELIRHHTTNGLNATDQSEPPIPLPAAVEQPNLPLLTIKKIGKKVEQLLSKEFDKPEHLGAKKKR